MDMGTATAMAMASRKRIMTEPTRSKSLEIIRIATIAIGTVIIAVSAGLYSTSRVSPSPLILPAFAASGHAPLQFVDKKLPPNFNDWDAEKLGRMSRRSIQKEALNARAVRNLAIEARAKGQGDAAYSLAKLAHRISRREAVNRMLMIDLYSTGKNKSLAGILKLYDETLRVKPELSPQLTPALASVLSAAEARAELAPYVKKGHDWTFTVLEAAAKSPTGPPDVVDTLERAFGNKIKMPENLSRALFSQLLATGQYGLAKRLFGNLQNSKASLLTLVTLNDATHPGQTGALGWQITPGARSGAEVQQFGKGVTALYLFAVEGSVTTPVTRLLYLPQGTYRMREKANYAKEGGLAEWRIKCLTEGKPPLQGTVTASGSLKQNADVKTSENFTISCPVQQLELRLNGGDDGLEMTLEEFTLEKLS